MPPTCPATGNPRPGIYCQELLTPELVQAYTEPFLAAKGFGALHAAAMALEHHQTEALVPVSVLWGQYDRFLPAYCGWRLHGAIPGARFRLRHGCGHFTMRDDPALLAQGLLEHLKVAERPALAGAAMHQPGVPVQPL